MKLPLFYAPSIAEVSGNQELDEENAKHILQVLRMKTGEFLRITDGKGTDAECTITSASKKNCTITILRSEKNLPPAHEITIAISILKNANRFEWFLEKAAETGVSRIVPLICKRTERQVFRESRWQNILVSAMLQSQQSWLTELPAPVPFMEFIEQNNARESLNRYMAHCEEDEKMELASLVKKEHRSSLVLIGPEGDFSREEIDASMAAGFQPVKLGNTRLRSETAGITSVILLRQLGA
jgi:16S rRNA (uracil1498-N3)-methyltransferase